MTGPRQINRPRRAQVSAKADGAPLVVDGHAIEAVRESWLIEDRWWTDEPLRRRYWEVVSKGGANLVVFHDLRSGRWFTQR